MGEYTHVRHEFPPVYNKESRILILGSLPSVKSREQKFYYGHPQNRFWKLLAGLTGNEIPKTIEDKKVMLLNEGIAVSDVIYECDIIGSSDSSIKNVVPMDLTEILQNASIQQIYANGGTAKKLYQRYLQQKYQMDIIGLPSTSPANAAFSIERLSSSWSCILSNLNIAER